MTVLYKSSGCTLQQFAVGNYYSCLRFRGQFILKLFNKLGKKVFKNDTFISFQDRNGQIKQVLDLEAKC